MDGESFTLSEVKRIFGTKNLTVTEVAVRFGVGTNAVRKAIEDGRLPCIRVLNRVLIPEAAIQDLRQLPRKADDKRRREEPVERMLTAPTRPRISSGVWSWISDWRT